MDALSMFSGHVYQYYNIYYEAAYILWTVYPINSFIIFIFEIWTCWWYYFVVVDGLTINVLFGKQILNILQSKYSNTIFGIPKGFRVKYLRVKCCDLWRVMYIRYFNEKYYMAVIASLLGKCLSIFILRQC